MSPPPTWYSTCTEFARCERPLTHVRSPDRPTGDAGAGRTALCSWPLTAGPSWPGNRVVCRRHERGVRSRRPAGGYRAGTRVHGTWPRERLRPGDLQVPSPGYLRTSRHSATAQPRRTAYLAARIPAGPRRRSSDLAGRQSCRPEELRGRHPRDFLRAHMFWRLATVASGRRLGGRSMKWWIWAQHRGPVCLHFACASKADL